MHRTVLPMFTLCLIWILSASFERAEAQATFHQIQISNDADDGYLNNNDGTGWHIDPQIGGADWVGSSSGTATAWVIGYRFPSTGINSGDTIQSAYLKLVSSNGFATSDACGGAPCPGSNSTFQVYGVAQDDGPPFSGVSGNTPLDVPYTTSYTAYTTTGPGDDHGSCQGNNNGQNTCTHIIDVTNIVREITSQPAWTNTSAMRFVLLSTSATANNVYAGYEDYDANSAKAATLVVNPPVPTVVSSGAWGTGSNVTYPTTYATGPFVYTGASTLLLYLGDYYNFYGESVGQPTITDSCENNWQILAAPTDWVGKSYDMRSTVYYVQNPASCPAGDTITVTVDNQEPIFLHFLAIAGSDTTQLPVASAITSPAPSTYTTTAPTDSITLTNAGLLVSWIFGDSDAPTTFTPASGFTVDMNSTPTYLTAATESVSSPGTYQNQFSISPSDGWQTVLIGLTAPAAAPPVITSSDAASATDGTAFSYQIVATNLPTSFTASGLPTGLTVSTTSGLISGTPSETGTFYVALSAVNSFGTGTATLTLSVGNQTVPTITWTTPSAISYGTALSSTQLDAMASVPGTFAYTPATGTVLSAGNQTLSVTFTPTDTTDYATTTQTVQLLVNQAVPTISWSTPAAVPYGTALNGIQLDASSTVAGAFAYTPAAGTVLSVGTQTLSVSFTPTNTADYTTATQTVQLLVNQAAPTVSWSTPAAISYGTALSGTQLDASSSVPGTFVYTPAAGTVLSAGAQTLSVTFTPTVTTDYTAASQTVQLVVNKASQTINFALPGTVTYGVAPITLTATGGASGNAVTFSVGSGPATITGNSLTITGTGIVQVAANQAGNANYLAAQVTQSINVVGAPLIATANNATRTYGTANPTFTGTVTGAVNGDTFSESFSTAATATSNAGTYPIVPGVTGADIASYSVTIQNGTLTVTQAGTETTLSVSGTSINPGQSLTLTATVVSTTSGTPTGTVTFYDGTAQLGTGALSSGTATYSTSSLAAGTTHVLTAVYGGDSNFLTSSTTSSTSVVVGTQNFSLTLSGSSSATVTEGGTATYQMIADPLDGTYPGAISFTASGLPTGATVSFSPSGIAANGGQQTVTATIQTAPTVGMNSSPALDRRFARISIALLLAPLLGIGRIRRSGRYFNRMLGLIVLIGAMAATTALIGCGGSVTTGSQGSQPQTFNVTITAAGGGLQQSVNVTLQVQ
ncbi:MAG: Ig-like domain repeat protein [Candidatus Korobacteraceae bacterium]